MGAGTYKRPFAVLCQTWYDEELIYSKSRSYTNSRTSTAVKRRRRPSPLDTTPGVWKTIRFNNEVYEATQGLSRRKGSASHVWNSGPTTESYTDSGVKVGDAVNAATRAFASNTGAGISTLEMPQSVRMIGRRAATFYQAVRLMGKGNFKGLKRLMNESTGYNISSKHVDHLSRKYGEGGFSLTRASAVWLEVNFGWKPFFDSLYETVEHAVSFHQEHGRVRSVGGARAGFHAQITNLRDFNLNRLGISNLAELAWDKLRLSFVIDWFFPVSSILRSMSAGRGLGTIYGWASSESVKTRYTNGVFVQETRIYSRKRIIYGLNGLQLAPSGGFWRTITSLALFQGLK